MTAQLEHYKKRDPKSRICARALCLRDGYVLVVERFKYGESYIVLPGGGIDEGETDMQAAARELAEETSIVAEPMEVVLVLEGSETHSEQRIVRCDYVSGEPHLPESSEEAHRTDDGQNTYKPMWVSIDRAKAELVPVELRAIL